MNSEERKAEARRARARADWWQGKTYDLATRADRIGKKIDKLLKEPMGERRRRELLRAPQRAVGHLLSQIARCERIVARHEDRISKLGFDTDAIITEPVA